MFKSSESACKSNLIYAYKTTPSQRRFSRKLQKLNNLLHRTLQKSGGGGMYKEMMEICLRP
jgi:hypothetical protein